MKVSGKRVLQGKQDNERGYALVAMMGVVMFALILTTVAAPPIKLEAQREREEEMLWRGHQVAKALEGYFRARGRFPNDLEELVKGVDLGVKKIRFLRPAAACDPMTPCDREEGTNWKLINPGDPLIRELLDAYVSAQQRGTIPLPPPPAILVQIAQMGGSTRSSSGEPTGAGAGAGAATGQDQDDDAQQNPQSRNNSGFSVGSFNSSFNSDQSPIVGVVSKKSDAMFRSYYGVEQYDRALFFAGVPVVAGGIYYPSAFNGMAQGGIGPNMTPPIGAPIPNQGGGSPNQRRLQ